MEENGKDLTSLGRYLNLLHDAMKRKENIPNRINTEMCNRYFKLYSDEHKRLFGCKPDAINSVEDIMKIKNANEESGKQEENYVQY